MFCDYSLAMSKSCTEVKEGEYQSQARWLVYIGREEVRVCNSCLQKLDIDRERQDIKIIPLIDLTNGQKYGIL